MKWVNYILFFFFLTLTLNAFGQSSADLKRRKEALTREIEELNRTLNKTSSSKSLSLKQIRALNTKIRLREQKIKTINSEISLLDNQISENTRTVNSLQAQLNALKKEYAGMVRFAFRNQSAYSKLMFIFAADNFNQAYKRLKYLQQFTEYRKKQARYIQNTQKDLNIQIVKLDKNKQEKTYLLKDEQKEKLTLGKEKKNQTQVLTGLTKKEKQLKQELSKKQKESIQLNRALQAAIAREIEAERRKATDEANKTETRTGVIAKPIAKGSSILAATPEAAKLSADFLDNRGRLPWPVANGNITEGFGRHSYGANVTLENNGVDISTSPGASVRAVFSGEVRKVFNVGSTYVVMIRHGEYFTAYSNLKSVNVSAGQKVNLKQTIGTVATDPTDDSTEVHFELWKGASPLNPSSWLAN
ncbi:MAG: murein hydrolase activator EnvC family protein [Sphingobacteriaceae bacterium]